MYMYIMCAIACTHTHTHPSEDFIFGCLDGLADLLHVGAKEEGQRCQNEQNKTK